MTSLFAWFYGLRRIVERHYGRVLADDHPGEYFLSVVMDWLKAAQVAAITEFKPNPAYVYPSKST